MSLSIQIPLPDMLCIQIFAVGSNNEGVSIIPILPINALASFIEDPSMVESSEIDYDPVTLTSQEKRDIKNLCIINVHGDSMSPVINNHSRVLAKRVPRPQWGNVVGIVGVSYNDTSDGFNDPYFVVKNVGYNRHSRHVGMPPHRLPVPQIT